MNNIIKTNKDLVAKCYLVVLAVSALLSKSIVYHQTMGIDGDEMILFWKNTPWTFAPMLMCALLAAFFNDKGYVKTVGLMGILLLLVTTIIQSGCALWASSPYDRETIWASLVGYRIRMPQAVFLVASGFMKGGAFALLISILSYSRIAGRPATESIALSISALFTVILALLVLSSRIQLSWSLIALVGGFFVLLLVPGAYLFNKLENQDLQEVVTLNEKLRIRPERGWFLPIIVFSICIITITSYWRYMPNTWRYYHIGVFYYYLLVLAFSCMVFAIALPIIAKSKKRFGSAGQTIQTGAILMLFGLPLGALFMEEILVEIIPMFLIGLGLAMITSSTIEYIITIPLKLYSLSWVGIVSVICLFIKLSLVAFNRIEAYFATRTIAIYIIYPLRALTIMVLGYLFARKEEYLIKE